MNYKDKIKSFNYSTIILSLTSFSFYGIFSSYIFYKTRNSSLISIFIGFIFSLLIAKIILNFYKVEESKTYTQKIKASFPKLSKIINIVSLISSIFAYLLITYRLTTFLSNEYLVETPKYLISFLIICLTYYISSKGIDVITKVSFVTYFMSIINFLFDFLTLISQINLNNLLPIVDVNITSIISSSLIFTFYFIIPIIYINVIPINKLDNKKKFEKYYYLIIFTSFIIIFISALTSIGVNGSKVLSLFDYPIYSTLKRIKLFNALDSLENLSISAWFLFIINTANIIIYYISSCIKEVFNTDKKITIIILIIVFLIQNLILLNNNFNESYDYIYIPIIYLLITLFIVIITLIKIKRTKKS